MTWLAQIYLSFYLPNLDFPLMLFVNKIYPVELTMFLSKTSPAKIAELSVYEILVVW